MTAPIYFNDSAARAYLLANGEVFTLRRPRGTVGVTQARRGSYVDWVPLGTVIVSHVCRRPTDEMLVRWVKQSGFSSVEAWRLAAAKEATDLYRVEMRVPLREYVEPQK